MQSRVTGRKRLFAQSLYVARHDRLRHGRGLGLTRTGSDALAPLFGPHKERLEPPRVCRRPQLLRGWGYGHEEGDEEILG